MRLLLLTNPRSGRGEASDVENELRDHGAEVQVRPIENAGDHPPDGVERYAVAGGDGSLGFAADAAARAGVALAVIPSGTANDFARALGLPMELRAACRLAVAGRRTRTLELGRMDGRPFVNVASAGLPPAAAREARGWKHRLGSLAYAFGAVKAGLRAAPVDCRVRCDERELFSGPAWQVTVACSGAFGAGSSVDADPADGLLEAVVIEAGSRVGLVRRALGLRRGSIRRQRGVRECRARRVRVEVPPGTGFNLDGELCECSGMTDFTVERQGFELVVG